MLSRRVAMSLCVHWFIMISPPLRLCKNFVPLIILFKSIKANTLTKSLLLNLPTPPKKSVDRSLNDESLNVFRKIQGMSVVRDCLQ